MQSDKVDAVMQVLKNKPQLVVAMHYILAVAYQEAGVTSLDDNEKKELYEALGVAIKNRSVTGPW